MYAKILEKKKGFYSVENILNGNIAKDAFFPPF